MASDPLATLQGCRSIINALPQGVLVLDAEGRVLEANPAACRMLGRSRDDLRAERMPTGPGAPVLPWSLAPLKADGDVQGLEVTSGPLPEGGTVVALSISRLKEAEDRLRESSRFSEQVLRSAQEGIIVYDRELHYQVWNPFMEQLTGIPASSVLGRHPLEIFPFLGDTGIMERLEKALGGDVVRSRDFPYYIPSTGKSGWNITICAPCRNARGEITGVIANVHDISERKRIEVALRESEERFNAAFQFTPVSMAILTLDDLRFLDVNKAFQELYGYSREELLGRTADEVAMWVDPVVHEAVHSRLRDGEQVRDLEARFRCRDGSLRWVSYSGELVILNGRPCLLSVGLDVTGRVAADAEIRHLAESLERRVKERTQQLEAAHKEMEAFSYSVSHDLRAPLRSIDGFSRVLMEDCSHQLDEEGRHYLERIHHGARRMGALIDDLLKLSRTSRAELSLMPCDLSGLCRRIAGDLAGRDPQRSVEVSIQPGLMASADPRLMEVALENLLGNAWKFTSRRREARIEIGSGPEQGLFFIRDNGAGFDMAYADKLFDAFQRLHPVTEFEGTGIGLAIVQRIIHRHGGRVWAEAEPGLGAAFFFTLPGGNELPVRH